MSSETSILLAEDDEVDVLLLQRAFAEAGITNPLTVARDGQEAIDFLVQASQAPGNTRLPGLLILDLKMPRRTGMDVLEWIRAQPVLRCLPVIIFSSSNHQHDVERAYWLGASAFIVKPSSTEPRAELAGFIKGFWLKFNQPPLMSTESFAAAQRLHTLKDFKHPSAP